MMKDCVGRLWVACGLRLSFLLLAGGGLTSCCQKELEFPDSPPVRVNVVFDWDKAKDASVEGMTVYLFPDDRHTKSWRFDIPGKEGGVIELPPGSYKLLAVNNDMRGIMFTSTDQYLSFTANARPLADDTITSSTGMLYGVPIPEIYIGRKEVRYKTPHMSEIISKDGEIRMFPDSLCTVYNVRVDSVVGGERIRSAKFILSGLADSVNLSTEINSQNTCEMSATLSVNDIKSGVLTGAGSGFGTPRIHIPTFSLRVLVATSHSVYAKDFDVTQQILNSLWLRNVYIKLSGLTIPSSDPPGGTDNADVGIEVGVDGWEVVEITYS